MFYNNCEKWWQHADYLPFDELIEYWCGSDPTCKEVKKFALISALEKGKVKYRRTDGKDFDDPVTQLLGRIAVERASFESWLETIDEPSPLPEQPGSVSTKTYQLIIGILLKELVEKGKTNQSGLVLDFSDKYKGQGIHGVGKSNLEKAFREANARIKEHFPDLNMDVKLSFSAPPKDKPL